MRRWVWQFKFGICGVICYDCLWFGGQLRPLLFYRLTQGLFAISKDSWVWYVIILIAVVAVSILVKAIFSEIRLIRQLRR